MYVLSCYLVLDVNTRAIDRLERLDFDMIYRVPRGTSNHYLLSY